MSGETVIHPEDMARIKEGLRDPKYKQVSIETSGSRKSISPEKAIFL